MKKIKTKTKTLNSDSKMLIGVCSICIYSYNGDLDLIGDIENVC